MAVSSSLRSAGLLVVAAAALGGSACSNCAGEETPPSQEPLGEVPPPELAGLELVPDDARAVAGLDLAALRGSKTARTAVTEVLDRDRELRAMAAAWRRQCGRELTAEARSAVIAFGRGQTQVLLAIEGVEQASLVACLRTRGAVESEDSAGGRSVHRLRGAAGPLWLAFSRPGTAVLSRDRDWLLRALSRGVKVSENDRMLELLARVDRDQALWFVARIPPTLGASLVDATDGEVAEGPLAALGTFGVPQNKFTLSLHMASASDARAARAFWRQERETLVTLAQGAALGPLVGRVRTRVADSEVQGWVQVGPDDVVRVAAALDGEKVPEPPGNPRSRKRRK